jgi:hypothetical protein
MGVGHSVRLFHEQRSLRHPAVDAGLSARNAVAAEMAVAGRADHHPDEDCWSLAARDERVREDAAWVLAGAAFEQMRADLACADAAAGEPTDPDDPAFPGTARRQARARALAALAVPVGTAQRNHDVRLDRVRRRKPAARRRREWIEMAFWFAVGGAGGLAALVLIRGTEAVLAWR